MSGCKWQYAVGVDVRCKLDIRVNMVTSGRGLAVLVRRGYMGCMYGSKRGVSVIGDHSNKMTIVDIRGEKRGNV